MHNRAEKGHESQVSYVGIVGMPLSGKDTVAEYLAEAYGFIAVNMNSPITEDMRKRSIELTRENYQRFADSMRKSKGTDIWAKRVTDDWIPYIEMNIDRAAEAAGRTADFEGLRYAISGIRNFEEVEHFRSRYDDFALLAILAPQSVRFGRTSKRKREGFDLGLSYEDFCVQDRFEAVQLGLGSSMAMADYFLLNVTTVENLHRHLDVLMASLSIGKQVPEGA